MAKLQKSYACNACGSVTSKWAGKCESCGEWNTIEENVLSNAIPKGMNTRTKGRVIDFVSLKDSENKEYKRHHTKIHEFDRVLGGGLVPGSATLIGGDPGIGKSTILLQALCAYARQTDLTCLYISGEEATDQVRMRAMRLGLDEAPVQLATATNVRDIVASLDDADIVIIDSIQTMYVDNIESAPGTVTQVRTSAQEIIRTAKAKNIAVIFVGHVTKDGQIAGPRVLEHLVDTVLHFEGDRSHHFRILRAVKNRFGPTDEIGVFEMAGSGLIEVKNPSEMFLSERNENVSGSTVLAATEGTRPLLVEIQALVAPTSFASPRRSVLGWDPNRLAMISAVLETRLGLQFSGCDIYLNVAGGIRITEPAADLAVAGALISALQDKPIAPHTIYFGEIGLSGEIRQVAQADLRLKEAFKLGFKKAVIPRVRRKTKLPGSLNDLDICTVRHVQDIEGTS